MKKYQLLQTLVSVGPLGTFSQLVKLSHWAEQPVQWRQVARERSGGWREKKKCSLGRMRGGGGEVSEGG